LASSVIVSVSLVVDVVVAALVQGVSMRASFWYSTQFSLCDNLVFWKTKTKASTKAALDSELAAGTAPKKKNVKLTS
jgi:hypothetical protein